jgi:hypothetical protein
MARPVRSRGPYRDPRLMERQGDVLGPSSLLLVVLMVCAVVVMGAFVVGIGRLVPASALLATPTPPAQTLQPVAVSTVAPAPTPTEPSSTPSSTPRPPVVALDALRVAFGDPAPIVERGEQVGTVTVESAVYRGFNEGVEAADGRRWLRVSLTFRSTANLTYDGNRWSALDANGRRHRWTRVQAPDPALGAGSLGPGKRRTGYLVLSVPSDVTIRSLVLQDADARDIVVLALR